MDPVSCQAHVVGHALRAAMGTAWKTRPFVWPGCITGSPSGVTSHLPPYDHTFSHMTPAPLKENTPLALMQPPAAGHSYISGHWGYSLRNLHFPSAYLQTLTASLCRHKYEKIGTQKKKRNMEEFDGFLILVRNQT